MMTYSRSSPKHRLNIDIETYSSFDLTKVGVYKYVEASDFEILMIAYSIDGGEVQILDLASHAGLLGNVISEELMRLTRLLEDKDYQKCAYNAQFERICLSKYLAIKLPIDQWRCSMVDSVRIGLPAGLGFVSDVLKLDDQKDRAGKDLIRYFSMPCKPTKVNGGRTRNLPHDAPDKWQNFKEYCQQDVRTEMDLLKVLDKFDYPDFEQENYILDQQINDRGVMLDKTLMEGAVACDIATRDELVAKAKALTGLDNPNSPAQLLNWLHEHGSDIPDLTKATVFEYVKSCQDDLVKQVLEIRQELSKSSVKKYQKMSDMLCEDNRVHGILQFYGAAKTGRWAGRGVQVQNLTKHYISDDDLALSRNLIKAQDFELLDLMFKESRQNLLSQLVRTTFVAKPGHKFVVYDFSAIEARVIAWFADEKWRQEVFATHGKIYEASASQMFSVPIEGIGKGSPLRQKGKVAELALGYQGGPNALIAMGALSMGIDEEELTNIVNAWREANPGIKSFWHKSQQAAIEAVRSHSVTKTHKCKFYVQRGCLCIELPSGRCLRYIKPHLTTNQFGNESLAHYGMNDANKWSVINTYGGKLVENIVQATARDCLAETLRRLDQAGYKCVMHVHDEVVLEVPKEDTDAMATIKNIMNTPFEWAEGLILDSAGFESEFYMKD